ncbi:melanoma-associated antigen 10 [Ochotona princeps]|uniref:melanoma-associated antigen 10 n=1 Tax=Ochotona princeps TaxID=9978 RepID=UPI00271459F5|nr:melanoma-associated antigen 10 [Ochotona princeps]XP_058514656.1 melanoma-associated antigen 10 [Ochotona princeps]
MPRAPKRRRNVLKEDLQAQCKDSSSSSTCSSSFPCSSSSSTSSSQNPPLSSIPEENLVGDSTQSVALSPQEACSSSAVMTCTPQSQSSEGASSQNDEGPSTSQAMGDPEAFPRHERDAKVSDLVEFFLHKYQINTPTSKEEILMCVIPHYQDHFQVIFDEASECMKLVFGIDVREVDPTVHSYALAISLGLTYDGMLSDVQGMPKTGLLILILSVIYMNGNCAPEEEIWNVMIGMGLSFGEWHYIYGEPGKLLTEDWVQEGYLECHQVPNSDPPRFQFLWGPRAHAEIRKMNLLKFLAEINESDPRAFPIWYEEALRDEQERERARIAAADACAIASPSSSDSSNIAYHK